MKTLLIDLIRHHDGLRLPFKIAHGSAHQNQHSVGSASRFRSFHVGDTSEKSFEGVSAALERVSAILEREIGRDQSSLDIENGPIVASTLFTCPPPDPPLLSLVIHHLVVDEVSWGVIADDLNLPYSHLVSGQHITLPPKSHSLHSGRPPFESIPRNLCWPKRLSTGVTRSHPHLSDSGRANGERNCRERDINVNHYYASQCSECNSGSPCGCPCIFVEGFRVRVGMYVF